MSKINGKLLIRARNISVVFNRRRSIFKRDPFPALKDVSLEIYSGEAVGVIGRNGVGKTTLLRVLADIIAPDSGSLENFNCSTAMLSMQAGFDSLASGRTNIFLSGLLLGYSEGEILHRMSEIIAYAELGDFIDQPLTTYSAGMRARLGFSICYFLEPDLLLIDEALGAGDIEFRKKSTQSMREKIQSDQTVVLVSHEPNTIQRLCNRAVWIEDGVSRLEGDAEEVVTAYKKYIEAHLDSKKELIA